jgi:hypothetical protein
VLLYLNRDWNAPGGRLRLLRSPDLDDFAVEIAPEAGTLLVFRRSETSWHGHAPFIGPRRAVQMSYVSDRATAVREERRHRLATSLKRHAPAVAHRLSLTSCANRRNARRNRNGRPCVSALDDEAHASTRAGIMTLLIIIIILVLLFGGGGYYGYRGGYYGGGGIGIVGLLLIIIVLWLLFGSGMRY